VTLKIYPNIINGRALSSTRTFESLNPATGEAVGLVPHSSLDEIKEAISAAKLAQPAWAARSEAERKAILKDVAVAIGKNSEHLARLVTYEQGKPLGGVGPGQVPGSRFELFASKAWTDVPADLDLPIEVVFEDDGRRDEVHRRPYGVVAAIAPWNWPLMIAIWQIIPAIRAGNTVVLKPSEYTSIATLELVRIISEVLPAGVLNTVTGPGDVGAVLTESPLVDKIMFTGSAATGCKIAATAARNVTPTTLELGGNDAAIVLPDADPKQIAMDLFWGAFINAGQTCACAKRVYVHESLHDALVEELRKIAVSVPMGNGMDDGVVMGPIQNRAQYDKVVSLVESAKVDGATIVCGGVAPDGPGYFYPLTLITDVTDGSKVVDEEQFGPVLPIIRYQDTDDAIRRANRLDTGLGASVWSTDIELAKSIASRIEVGTVWINHHGVVHPMVPFGGAKRSGWGVEFGIEGLKSMTRPHVISIKKR